LTVTEPWKLNKRIQNLKKEISLAPTQPPASASASQLASDEARFFSIMYVACEGLRIALTVLQPFMPGSAAAMLSALGVRPHYTGVSTHVVHALDEYL
jgi:hypothetical protein